MKQIQITVNPGGNFTPASLMQRYAWQTPGVKFQNSVYGGAELSISGCSYCYHHWQISGDVVTLYLLERDGYESLNPMCRNCTKLYNGCEGTHHRVWTGCVRRSI